MKNDGDRSKEELIEELRTLRRQVAEVDALNRRLELAERMLEKEIRYREAMVWNLPVFFVTIGRDGRVIAMNRKVLSTLGYKANEVVGRDFTSTLIAPRQQMTVQTVLRSLRSDEQPTVYETLMMTKDGADTPVEWHAMALVDDHGDLEMIFQVGLDKVKELECDARLRHAERLSALGQLTSGIAHDFNNLLLAIQGNVSLMLLDIDELVDEQVRKGAGMTRKLLEYSGESRRNVRVLDLNALVEENSYAFSRARKEMTIDQDLAPDLFQIAADARSIDQVLLDMFVNAASAMPRGGQLTIHTSNVEAGEIACEGWVPAHDTYVKLQITDSGPLYDQEHLQQLFEPQEGSESQEGVSSLGLSAAFRIIKESRGHMEARPGPDRGTIVTAYLPAFVEKSHSDHEVIDVSHREGTSILLIDDEKIVLNVGGRLLRKLGYRVTEAGSGKEAIALFRRDPSAFDLVILDIVMPDMSGNEVFNRLRRIDPEVKVFIASGYSVDGQATEILSKGACGFVQKPFSLNTLAESLDRVLS
jgi:PAS domain S-box-containing protein